MPVPGLPGTSAPESLAIAVEVAERSVVQQTNRDGLVLQDTELRRHSVLESIRKGVDQARARMERDRRDARQQRGWRADTHMVGVQLQDRGWTPTMCVSAL